MKAADDSRQFEASPKIRERYRKLLERPALTDRQIDESRKHVVRLAQTICEHVWGKKFY